MKPLFNHSLITSFALYLDHELLNGAQAYSNVSTGLYRMVDPSVRGNVWASPYKAWVSDSCVSGAAIPSGVYNSSGQFLTRGSGVVIDFLNGRVIAHQNWGGQLSGTFAKKDFNIYTSTEQQTQWLLEDVFSENKDLYYASSGVPGGPFVAPCIILTNSHEENEPWALGGVDQTKNTIVGYVISSNGYQQEGVNSFARDMAHGTIALVGYGDAPWGTSGDLKSPPYCYDDLCASHSPPSIYVEKVFSTRINQRANKATTFLVSVIEWDLVTVRQPHTSR